MKSFQKISRSFSFGLRGLVHAYETDQSFRLEVHVGFPIFFFFLFVLRPLTWEETAWLWFSYVFILVIELINSSIERLLDRLHPDRHELIGHAKDLLAGAMVVAFVFAGIIVGSLLISRFF